jgi:hypothetical protein
MSWMQVETRDGISSFRPGDTIDGVARWQLDKEPKSVELRLFWYTKGKGDQDVGIVRTVPFDAPGAEDRRTFRVAIPAEAPPSFSGRLISLLWALEVVALPSNAAGRQEVVISPTGREIAIPMLAPGDADASGSR